MGPAAQSRPASVSSVMLVISSGGVHNTGDDAILRRCLGRLERLGQPAPDLLLDGPDHEPDLPPVRMIGRLDECAASIDVRRYDSILISGGGWAADHFAPQLAYRAVVAERAAAAGRRVLLSGQGIGPLDDAATASVARRVLGPATAISVRDPLSRDATTAIGIDDSRVRVTGDDALGLGVAPSQEVDEFLRANGIEPALPFILFQARDANYSGGRANLEPWAGAVDRLATSRRSAVLAVSVNNQFWAPEEATLRALEAAAPRGAPWHITDVTGRSELLHGLVARSRAVITASYHVALFGVATATPTTFTVASPYYAAKAEGLRRLAALPAEFVCDRPIDDIEMDRWFGAVGDVDRAARELAAAAADVDGWYAEYLGS